MEERLGHSITTTEAYFSSWEGRIALLTEMRSDFYARKSPLLFRGVFQVILCPEEGFQGRAGRRSSFSVFPDTACRGEQSKMTRKGTFENRFGGELPYT